jgi:hypothetical protein
MKRGLFIASAAAVAVAPLVPLPAPKPAPFTLGTIDFEAAGYGIPTQGGVRISDAMLRQIEQNLLKMTHIVRAEARRSSTPGCIDVNVTEMTRPQWIDIKFTAAGEIDLT